MFYTRNEVRTSLWTMTSHLLIISKLQGMLACLLSAMIWLAGGKDPGMQSAFFDWHESFVVFTTGPSNM
jgi:hypothetical protein